MYNLLYYIFALGFGNSSGEFIIRYYAKNLQSRGINANTIIPGVVNTELHRVNKILKDHDVLKITGQRRALDPSEIGKVARFLCNDGMAITGVSINVDYGIHLGK